jgi:hypothetical protein
MRLDEAQARLEALRAQLDTFFADLALRWLKRPMPVAAVGDDRFRADMIQAASHAAARAPIGASTLLERVDLAATEVVAFAANESAARRELSFVGRSLAGPLFRHRQPSLRNKFKLIEGVVQEWTIDLGHLMHALIELGHVNALFDDMQNARPEIRAPLNAARDELRRRIKEMQAIDDEAAARFGGRRVDLGRTFTANNEVFGALRSVVDNRAEEALRTKLSRIVGHEVDTDGFEPAASLSPSHEGDICRFFGLSDFATYSAILNGHDGDLALRLASGYRRGPKRERGSARSQLLVILARYCDDAAETLDVRASVLAKARSYLSRRNIAWRQLNGYLARQGDADDVEAVAPDEGDAELTDGSDAPDVADAQAVELRTATNDTKPGDGSTPGDADDAEEEAYEDDSYWQRRPQAADLDAERRGELEALLMVSAATQLLVLARKEGVAWVPMAGQPVHADVADLHFVERKLVYAASSSTLKRCLDDSANEDPDAHAIGELCAKLAEHVHPVLGAGEEKGATLKALLGMLCTHWRQNVPAAADQLLGFELNARKGFALTAADYQELVRWAEIARDECAAETRPRKFLLRYLMLDREALDEAEE